MKLFLFLRNSGHGFTVQEDLITFVSKECELNLSEQSENKLRHPLRSFCSNLFQDGKNQIKHSKISHRRMNHGFNKFSNFLNIFQMKLLLVLYRLINRLMKFLIDVNGDEQRIYEPQIQQKFSCMLQSKN